MSGEGFLSSVSRRGGSSGSSSESMSFDYSGQDIAHKYQDELSGVKSQHSAAMMSDPLSAMPINKRIGHLQQYLRAYHTGHNPRGLGIIPGARVASYSSSSSSNSDSSGSLEFEQPKSPYEKS